MKYLAFIFFLIVFAVFAAAAPCDFVWNTPFYPTDRCSGSPKQYGGIPQVSYSAVGHNIDIVIKGDESGMVGPSATNPNPPHMPLYKTGYYTVKGGTGSTPPCTPELGTAPNPTYQWCPFDLTVAAGATAYRLSSPTASNKWFNVRATAQAAVNMLRSAQPPQSVQIPSTANLYYGPEDNYIAVFMCGCSAGCSLPSNWECNPGSSKAGQKGTDVGRWIIMPLNHCLVGETRGEGCASDGAGGQICTTLFNCNDQMQWVEMKSPPGSSCSSNGQCTSNSCVANLCQ